MDDIDSETRQLIRQRFKAGIYTHPGYMLPCPNCNRQTTVPELPRGWWCWTCNIEFGVADTTPYYSVEEYKSDCQPDLTEFEEV